jgi:hypothetical protein
MARKPHIAEIMDQAVINSAVYFTAIRKLAPGKGYDRREAPTLAEAETLGREMGGRVLIYAVNAAGRSAHVKNV